MHPIARLFEQFNILLPCNENERCRSCCRFAHRYLQPNLLSSSSMSHIWSWLLGLPSSESCTALRKLQAETQGTLVSIKYCSECHIQSTRSWMNDPIQSCRVYSTQTVIPFSGLGAFTSHRSPECSHGKLTSCQAFGDIPRIALLRFNSRSATASGQMSPIDSAHPQTVQSPVRRHEQIPFFRKYHISVSGLRFYLSPSVALRNGPSEGNESFFRLLKIKGGPPAVFRDKHFQDHALSFSRTSSSELQANIATRLLQDIFLGQRSPACSPNMPRVSRKRVRFETGSSGTYRECDSSVPATKVLSSHLYSPLRRAFAQKSFYTSPLRKKLRMAPRKDKETPSSPSVSIPETEPGTTGDSSISSCLSDSGDSSEAEHGHSAKPLDPQPTKRFAFMRNDKFSLPFLIMSIADMATGIQSVYEPVGVTHPIDQVEQEIASDNTKLLALSASSTSAVDFGRNFKGTSDHFHNLNVTPDIDSLDFVTTSMAGTAFANSAGAVLLRWEPRFNNLLEAQRRNNNLVYLRRGLTADVFPGAYFVDESKTHFKFRSYNHPKSFSSEPYTPLQLQILQMRTSFSSEQLKVYALLPSEILRKMVRGNACLLRLFREHVQDEEVDDINIRQTQCEMAWYMVTELLLFCASTATVSGSEMIVFSRDPCCAIPSPANRASHDRKHGQFSDFLSSAKFRPGVLTIAFLYMARFLRALEQHSGLQEAYQNSDYKKKECYKLPAKLLPLCANADVLKCLSSPIGSRACLNHFRALWKQNKEINRLISFQSDPRRHGVQALPTSSSNQRAFRSKHLFLEDLLYIDYVLFRGTIHGMKASLFSSKEASTLFERFKDEINTEAVLDGIIDIGYTMRCPNDADFGVLVKCESFTERLFLPVSCERTFRDIGAYLTTGPGFPSACGFATSKASVGKPSTALHPDGIRRVKVYTTKWRADNVRGNSIYEQRVPKMEAMLDGTTGLFESLSLDQNSPQAAQNRSSKRLSEHWNHYDVIEHNINSRETYINKPQNGLGVRIEITCYLDKPLACLEKIFHLLTMQEHVSKDTSQAHSESVRLNPDDYPWWCAAPEAILKAQNNCAVHQETLPVLFVQSRDVMRLSLSMEKGALRLSRQLHEDAISLCSNYGLALERPVSSFMETLFEALPLLSFWRLVSLLTRGLLSAARCQVDSCLVNIHTFEIASTNVPLQITGVSVSWSTNGLPKILLSRLLTSSEEFNNALTAIGIVNSQWIRLTHNDLQVAVDEDDQYVPFRMRMPSPEKMARWLDVIEGDKFTISGDDRDIVQLWRIAQNTFHYSLKASTLNDIQGLQICPDERLMKECVRASVQLVALLIHDIFQDLQKHGSGLSRYGLHANKPILQKSYINLEASWIDTCTRSVRKGRSFPSPVRIDFERSSLSRELQSLQRCFRGELNVSEIQSSNIPSFSSSSNDITAQSFIFTFWEHAKHLESSLHLLPEKGRRKRPVEIWKSLKFARVLVDVLAVDKERCVVIGKRESRLGRFFKSHFAKYIALTLSLAGFTKLCPVLTRPLHSAGVPSGSMLFKPLLFGCLDTTDDVRLCLGMLNPVKEITLGSNTAQAPMGDELEDLMSSILSELEETSEARKNSSSDCEEFRSATRAVVEKQLLMWRRDDFCSLLMTILTKCVTQYKDEYDMDDRTSVYIRRVVGDLISLRSQLGDEGIAAYRDSSGIIRTIRNNLQSQQQKDAEKFHFQRGRVFSQPWGQSLYPDPYDFEGQNRKNKNTKIRDAAHFLSLCGFTFKAVRKGGQNTRDLSQFRNMLVQDVYERFRRPNSSEGNAYWRLMPTTKLLMFALEYVSSGELPLSPGSGRIL